MSQSEITTANCPSLVSAKMLRHKTPALEGTEGKEGYLGAHQNPCPCSGSPEHPRINSIEITFTSSVVGYLRGWPSLRLGLNDQLECPAARRGGGKETDNLTKDQLGKLLLTSHLHDVAGL